MTNFEAYLLLFTDALINNLAISINYEFVFATMRSFGNYNKILMILSASFGSSFAFTLNYLLGIIIGRILGKGNTNNFILKYMMIILLLSAVPFFGKFVLVIAGLYRYNIGITMLICSTLKFIYYNYLLLQ